MKPLGKGSELWDLRLVDPDNRGSVDFEKRYKFLRTLTGEPAENAIDLLRHWADGQVKMHVMREPLRYVCNVLSFLPEVISFP
jgi:(1->4)-alpha-D-glucan 1-alpha-D-glucosylmutase